jgi:hypothetical protein
VAFAHAVVGCGVVVCPGFWGEDVLGGGFEVVEGDLGCKGMECDLFGGWLGGTGGGLRDGDGGRVQWPKDL